MTYSLRDLIHLRNLKKRTIGKNGRLDTSKLEKEFLGFSRHLPDKELLVPNRKLYKIEGDEKQHLTDALETFSIYPDEEIKNVDITGAFDYSSQTNSVIILSTRQIASNHFSSLRSHLNPIIQEIYSKGYGLIQDFAIHEALRGEVKLTRGPLELDQVGIFPERFSKGPYQLSVTIDTPRETVKEFIELTDLLKESETDPKSFLLNPDKVFETTDKSIGLSEILGPLSRTKEPKSHRFSASTNSAVIKDRHGTQFFLYKPGKRQNILIYFGDNPFPNEKPRELTVMNGEDYQNSLVKLVELGFYEPSEAVLDRRISDLDEMYKLGARSQRLTKGERNNYKDLLTALKSVQDYFGKIANPDYRKKYILDRESEIVEFMVYPTTQDPIVHELLGRLSWNGAVRNYQNTTYFINNFERSNEESKKEILTELKSSLIFLNNQNKDVNRWLYDNQKKVTEETGLKFRMES